MSPRPHTGNPGGCHLRAPTTGPTRGRSGGIELCDSQHLRPGDRQSPLTCGYGICGVSQVKASRGPLRGPTAVLRTQTAAPTVPLGPGGPSASRPCRPLTARRAAGVTRRGASCSRLRPRRGVPQRVRCARNGRDVHGVEHLDDDASDRRAVVGSAAVYRRMSGRKPLLCSLFRRSQLPADLDPGGPVLTSHPDRIRQVTTRDGAGQLIEVGVRASPSQVLQERDALTNLDGDLIIGMRWERRCFGVCHTSESTDPSPESQVYLDVF
jgi:hypothetical protein